jgi:hypothetical protein
MVKVRVSTISQKILNVTNVPVTNDARDQCLCDKRPRDERPRGECLRDQSPSTVKSRELLFNLLLLKHHCDYLNTGW